MLKEDDISSEDECKQLGLVRQKPVVPTAPLRVTVQIRHDKEKFAALLDTGTSRSIVNKSFVLASAKHK